jgi:hypothetical protein
MALSPEQSADKAKRIKRERTKLRRLLRDMGKERLSMAEKLIDQAAFMGITLEDLAADISENGCTSEYQNGENQWGTKKSPEVEVHTSMMQRYLSTIKQLTELLPAAPAVPQADKPGARLMAYVAGQHGCT